MKRNHLKRIAGKLWSPFRNAAAILLALILLSAGVTVWTNSQTAHALKFRIDQLLYENGEPSVSPEDSEGNDKDVISMKITDPKELTAVKRQIPELRIPENLPEGYEFSSAEVERWENGNWIVRIYYICSEEQGNSIIVNEENIQDELEIRLKMKAEEIETTHGIVYYIEENAYMRGAYFIVNDTFLQVSGTLEKTELLKIAETLR